MRLMELRNPLLAPSSGVSAVGGATIFATAGLVVNHAFASNSVTFTATTVNNPNATDLIVICAGVIDGGQELASGTIGGNSLTRAVVSTASGVKTSAIFYRKGEIYTTPNIVINTDAGGAVSHIGISVYYITGNLNPTPSDTDVKAFGYDADPQRTGNLVVPVGGFGVACGSSETGGNDPAWEAGITEDYDLTTGGGFRYTSGKSAMSAGTIVPGINGWNFGGSAMAAAAWGP